VSYNIRLLLPISPSYTIKSCRSSETRNLTHLHRHMCPPAFLDKSYPTSPRNHIRITPTNHRLRMSSEANSVLECRIHGEPRLIKFSLRRNNSQKAWTQGTNPLTQKPSYAQQNGNTSHQKPLPSPKPMGPKETNTPDKHANDRLIFLLSNCIVLSPSK
jgi:hypothetical protein